MKKQTLNGSWDYRIGKGSLKQITVPFSALPVGHSEFLKGFDLEAQGATILLKFYGITYYGKVFLNGAYIGEMGPYCEYSFDITHQVREKGNELRVEIEDIAPAFGPTEGWENYGGIIRDVELLYLQENYIEDVFFHTTLENDYRDALFTIETKTHQPAGSIRMELFYKEELITEGTSSAAESTFIQKISNVKLWSPDTPELYSLKVSLFEEEKLLDVYTCNVGFREFKCSKHRFLLNGKPLFLKGVCKHEMFGDSGHCPSEEQMLTDMQMIKETGCNFVRLVHYPHNKKILDIADRLGLMVSEEPGLWWSDTKNPEVANGSLEVLRRTILRDKNHPSIVFWLCFNECRFTEQYLIDSANLCRKLDPTRPVSGANCMSNEDTLKYYNLCGFDFYTMHPYSQTIDRAKESAKMLHDKPLLFTEWGGHFVYDNPKLLGEFIEEMYRLYLADSDEGALAGAFFWEWSELNDFNRGRPACIDGNLSEGLVDKYRNPRLIYHAFCNALANLGKDPASDFWLEQAAPLPADLRSIELCSDPSAFNEILCRINAEEKQQKKMRKRKLKHGPILQDIHGLLNTPLVLTEPLSIDCDIRADTLCFWGMTGFLSGYPLGGDYGEAAVHATITYHDGYQETVVFRNGQEITTVFALNGSSRIDPVAENAKRIALFGYDKNFEYYLLNQVKIPVDGTKRIKTISICPENSGYAVLLYGITY